MFDEAVKYCEKHGDITEISDDYETPVGNLKAWVRTEIAVVRGISKLA